MNVVIDYLEKFAKISDITKAKLLEVCSIKSFSKSNILINKGEISGDIYFIINGAIRGYYYQGCKEITHTLAFENEFIAPFYSFYNNVSSGIIYQAIENSEVIIADIKTLEKDFLNDIEICYIAYKLVAERAIIFEERLLDIQYHSAKERFDKLINKYPTIFNRVPLSHIASYLGISRKTLFQVLNGK